MLYYVSAISDAPGDRTEGRCSHGTERSAGSRQRGKRCGRILLPEYARERPEESFFEEAVPMAIGRWLLVALAVCMFAFFCGASGAFPRSAGAEQDGNRPAKYVQVYYFHGKIRCYSCNRIEQLTVETVRQFFRKELETGRLRISVVNVEDPENSHFVKDYQLYSQSVILSERDGDREVKWKNLIRVWELLKDDDRFKEYVRTEVEAFLAAA